MKAQRYKEVLLFAALLFAIFAASPRKAQAAVCGDLECDSEESASGCPIDCGVCGDLECDPSESSASCELDCLAFCGDLICDSGEESACPGDCQANGSPICGDGVCAAGESDCPIDCIGSPGSCSSNADCNDEDPCTIDSCDPSSGCKYDPLPDVDADGTCDSSDADDDNDGVADGEDAGPTNPKVCRDADQDTCDDCAVGSDGFGSNPDFNPANDGPDNEQDGFCDAGDPDDDNDGLIDTKETVTDPFDPDTDEDGVCDGKLAVQDVCTAGRDNCPVVANPRQSDIDADGRGDACDSTPVEDVSGICPCDSCPDDLVDAEIPGVPGYSWHVTDKATCRVERDWINHGEYVSCVTHVTNFLRKYVAFDKSKVQNEAARSRCGRGRYGFGGHHGNNGHYWYDGFNGFGGHDRYGGHDGYGGHAFCSDD